jgi:hypothetical protein
MINEIDRDEMIRAEIEQRKLEAKKQATLNMESAKAREKQFFNEAEMKVKEEEARRKYEEQQSFYWETQRQRYIRYELQALGDNIASISNSSSYVVDAELKLNVLTQQYRELEKEYLSTPYKLPKETFKQVLVYENQNKDVRLESRDNGLTWQLYEIASNGLMSKTAKKIEAKDGKPSTINGIFATDYVKQHFNGMAIPTRTPIELLEDKPFEEPKVTPRSRINFGWQCFACKEMNGDDKAMICKHCGAKRKY